MLTGAATSSPTQTNASEPLPLPAGSLPAALVYSEPETARLLNIDVRTLQRMRAVGDAPPSILVSARRRAYPVRQLQEWIERRLAGAHQ